MDKIDSIQILYLSKNIHKNTILINHFISKNNVDNLDKIRNSLPINDWIIKNNVSIIIREVYENTFFIVYPGGCGGNFLRNCLELNDVSDKNSFVNGFKNYNLNNDYWNDHAFYIDNIEKNIDGVRCHYRPTKLSEELFLKESEKILLKEMLVNFNHPKTIIINNHHLFYYLRNIDWDTSTPNNIIGEKTFPGFSKWKKSEIKKRIDLNGFYKLPKEIQYKLVLNSEKKTEIIESPNTFYWNASWFLFKEDFLYNIERFYNIFGLTEFNSDILEVYYDIWINSLKSFIYK